MRLVSRTRPGLPVDGGTSLQSVLAGTGRAAHGLLASNPHSGSFRPAITIPMGTLVDIAAWLSELGLERYAQVFRDSEIEPEVLAELTDLSLIHI